MDEEKIDKILNTETEQKKQLITMFSLSKLQSNAPPQTDIEEMTKLISSLTSFASFMHPTIEESERLQSLISAKPISWIKYFIAEKDFIPALTKALSNKENSRSGKDITIMGNLLKCCKQLYIISKFNLKVTPSDVITNNIVSSICTAFLNIQNFAVKTSCLEILAIAANTEKGST